jgi:hypothetical protein
MPLKECQIDGKKGFKWGDAGKCYTYEPGNETEKATARRKAMRQAVVIMESEGKIHLSEQEE